MPSLIARVMTAMCAGAPLCAQDPVAADPHAPLALPTAWADEIPLEELERAVDAPILWLQTPHFTIGSALAGVPAGFDSKRVRAVHAEVDALRAALPDVPRRPKTLDPWLRVHLTAQRLETHYAAFLARMGATQADFQVAPATTGHAMGRGPHLGRADRFHVLLLQTEAQLARVRAAVLARPGDEPLRFFHRVSDGFAYYTCAEAHRGALATDLAVHADLIFHTTLNFVDAWRTPSVRKTPLWLQEGLAHVDGGAISTELRSFSDYSTDREDRLADREWLPRVARMAQRGTLPEWREVFSWSAPAACGTREHAVSWALAQHLAQQPGALRALLDYADQHPYEPATLGADGCAAWHRAALQAALEWDLDTWQRKFAAFARRGLR